MGRGVERIARRFATALAALCTLLIGPAPLLAQKLPQAVATPVGAPQVLYDPARNGCEPNDIPDAPLRAFRRAEGGIAAFGLHFDNRRLVGPHLGALKLECPIVFAGTGNADPARYDDRIWLAATWTTDGKRIHALGHAEYHGIAHPGRCTAREHLHCLWIATLALRSEDGGAHFARLPAPVVAAPVMRSEQEQGRHRGFFNPTNIIEHGGALHYLVAQTGGAGQPHGICLFQTRDIAAGRWKAWDGKGFNATFPDPYGREARQSACAPLAPFPLVPGSVTRHRPSGLWLAIYPVWGGAPDGRGGHYAGPGFYLAASRDLIVWSEPTLVLATKSVVDDPCGESAVRSYPVLIDEGSRGRNFEDTGDSALLVYSEMRVENCRHTSDRKMVARRVRITVLDAQ